MTIRSWVGRSVGVFCTGALLMSVPLTACGGSSDGDSSGGSSGSGATGGTSGGGTGGGSGGAAGTATGGAAGTASGGAAGSATGGSGGVGAASGVNDCVKDVYDGLVYVDYDQFGPTVGSHCKGTNHQDITGVEKVVFLGDSITVGTFPTPANQVYREVLTGKLKAKFGDSLEVASCAVNGARVDDFFTGDNQIPKCFPGPEQKKTLIIITMGGNDIADMAKKKKSATESQTQSEQVIADMLAAAKWLKDPTNFPNGSYLVFANIYEYTGMTGDLSSCPTGAIAGFSGTWEVGIGALGYLREQYMKIAVDTGSDMILMGEEFCGHGYKNNDTKSQCYIGPNTPNWFDISCIHPTPEGHSVIADMFMAVVDE